jgi:NADP-dependent 3-hydroxy acid dehydrogenase YdfG
VENLGQSQQVVVITGASAGIGEALAANLARRGAALVLAARREDVLRAVAERCGPLALPVVADVTDRTQVQRVVRAGLSRFGHIDVWVNNAGRGITRAPSELTDEDVDEMVAVNVKSVLYGMQEILPHYKERGRGHVINVSSLLGRIPNAVHRSAYNGAKHFVNGLTASFRAEIQQTHPDIHVSLVSPGVVRTGFGLAARYGGPDSRRFAGAQSAEEVAEVISSVIERPRPDVYTFSGAHELVARYFQKTGEDP